MTRLFRAITVAGALLISTATSAVFADGTSQASGPLADKLKELGGIFGPRAAEEADPFVRYRELEGEGRLELRDVTFEGPNGARVELTGAIHVGDRCYYEGINTHLKQFDSVLFELVAPRETIADIQKGNKDAAVKEEPGSLAELYRVLARDILHLTCQMEMVDYTLPTMVHADLAAEEFAAAVKEGNLDASAIVSPISDWKMKLLLAAVKMLTPKEDPAAVKRMLAPVFGQANTMKTGNPKLDELIIERRNRRVIEVLDRQIAAGKRNLSIFYGAGHFKDLSATLLARGWKQTGENWRPAWVVPAPPK